MNRQVVIFTGMLGITPNDDSLAAILGHEVGHVLANHGGEKLSNVSLFFLKLTITDRI